MLPRDQGGVVDSNLKVYGTSNIYVADASVIPLVSYFHAKYFCVFVTTDSHFKSLGTHTMATIYGIAHMVGNSQFISLLFLMHFGQAVEILTK